MSDYEGAAAEKKEKGSTYVVDGLLAIPISDEEIAFDLVVGLVDGGGAVLDFSHERLAVPAVERLFDPCDVQVRSCDQCRASTRTP